MVLAHKVAIDPTAKQANALARAAGVSRFTWNWALAEWNRQWALGEKPTALKLKRQWNALKREQFPWVLESPKGANQQPFANLARAFGKFFKKQAVHPVFKKRGQHDAFYVENDRLKIEDKIAQLPVIGTVRLREPLRFAGKVMGGVVSRTAGRWFLSVQVDVGDAHLLRSGAGAAGIDLGLSSFAVFSTGEKVVAPKPLAAALRRLRRVQRVVSRRVKGSVRKGKARQLVARIHYRVANVRQDFLHKLSTRVMRENQAVTIEDLSVHGMMRNRRLSRAIADAGWAEFRRQLQYKAVRYGCTIVVADRFYPSSKTCHGCGQVCPDLKLSDRVFRCGCGWSMDRDINAAMNLSTVGLTGIYARGPEGSGGGRKAATKPRRVEARTTPEGLT